MEDPNRRNIMKAQKAYTIEYAIIVAEKTVKAINPQTINSCWRKLCPNIVYDFTRFMTQPIKEILKEFVDVPKKKKKKGRGGTKICLIEISASELVPGDEKGVLEEANP